MPMDSISMFSNTFYRKNCPITVIFKKKCVWTACIFHLSISSTMRNISFSGQSFHD